MSQENVDIFRSAYEALQRHDLHNFLEYMHPDIEATSRVLEVEGAVYRGRDGMREFIEEIWSVFPDWSPEVGKTHDLGDVVVAEIRSSGRGIESGVELSLVAWQTVRLRDGKAIEVHGYETEADALQAVGLRE